MKAVAEPKINIALPFQKKIVSKIPLPYPLAWLILGELVFFLHFLTLQFYEGSMKLVLVSIILSILIFLQGSIVIWISKQLEHFYIAFSHFARLSKKESIKWYNHQLKAVFNNKIAFITGLLIAIAVLLTINFHSSWPSWFNLQITKISFNFLLAVAAYLMGAGIYVILMTAVLVINVSELPLRISIYQHPYVSVKAIGRIFLKFSFCVISVYCIWVFAIFLSPLLKHSVDPIVLSWMGSVGIFVLLYFIVPQYRIHEMMVKEKHEKIRKFSIHLDEALELVTGNPSTRNINRLRQLLEIQQQLNGMENWPFDMKSFLYLLSAIIVPLLALLIKLIFG